MKKLIPILIFLTSCGYYQQKLVISSNPNKVIITTIDNQYLCTTPCELVEKYILNKETYDYNLKITKENYEPTVLLKPEAIKK